MHSMVNISGNIGTVHGVQMNAVYVLCNQVYNLLDGIGNASISQGFRIVLILV